MEYKHWNSLTELFFTLAEERAKEPFLWAKQDDNWQAQSWQGVSREISRMAAGLKALGVKAGERIVVVSENRPEWFIADMAIMTLGAITVPAYTTNTRDDHLHVLTDSDAKGAIVSSAKLAKTLLPAAQSAPHCRWLISIEPLDVHQEKTLDIYEWETIAEKGKSEDLAALDLVKNYKREDIACIIYTSGTSGTPRGVMQSHGNILSNCEGAYDVIKEAGLNHETFLSFLPLSHAYEHTVGQFFPLYLGAEIYYAEGFERLSSNFKEVKPTIMASVPRLYEVLFERIKADIKKQPEWRQKLMNRAVELGKKRLLHPENLTLFEKVENMFFDLSIRHMVRRRFGGRLKGMVSGGAALNPEIGEFFTALGLRIFQGYGLTEVSPLISVNRPEKLKMDTVGPVISTLEVKIADDKEILVRGESVMQGYWRDEDATKESFMDGWLRTGDLGYLDEDDYLVITGRKKDIIVLGGGDNISPNRIEGILTLEDEIAQAMVYGDKKPHLVALIVPDEKWLRSWAKSHDKDGGLQDLHEDEDLHKALKKVISRVNSKLSNIEKIRRFTIADEPFTQDNTMLTPTYKIRRHVIKEKYEDELEALYKKGDG